MVEFVLTAFGVFGALGLVFALFFASRRPISLSAGQMAAAVCLLVAMSLVGAFALVGNPWTPTGCARQAGSNVLWDNNDLGHDGVPESGTSVPISLPACRTALFDGGRFRLDDTTSCDGQGQYLCVVLWEVTDATAVEVNGVETAGNFYGITTSDYQSAISNKKAKWWEFPNCGSGCDGAYVTVYVDGHQIQRNEFVQRQ